MIQNWIHGIEVGGGFRFLKCALLGLLVIGLLVSYNLHEYKNMSNPEAMDAAQLARNLAEGKGYTTLFVRPFSLFLLQRTAAEKYGPAPAGDTQDRGMIRSMHPDLANPPVYPLLLAGLMKASPRFKYQSAGTEKAWNRNAAFWIYEPDFLISLFNQALFLIAVMLVFFMSRRLFDSLIAWTTAGIFLGTDLFWRFSISCLSTTLLMLFFIALAWMVAILEKTGREGKRSQIVLISLAGVIGIILGAGCLTRYSFGWLLLPVLVFLVLFLGQHRVVLCFVVLTAFAIVTGPWVLRNYRLTRTPFGVAGYSIYEGTPDFPEHRIERSLNPDLSRVDFDQIWGKFINNLPACLQDDLPKLAGSWITAFFLVGLFLPYKNPTLNRLRYFSLLCLPVLLTVQSLGRTVLSEEKPVINSENVLVLLAPLVIMFGVSFFYILLEQTPFPGYQFRYLTIGAFCAVLCLPAIIVCGRIVSVTEAVAYPPYRPPVIQTIANWMKENELIMSDIPWGVAWYGRRQCIWLTLNTQTDFFEVYNHQKPVKAIYLTQVTTDGRFLSQWVRTENSWFRFAIEGFLKHELPPNFPLQSAPDGFLPEQLFVTDSSDRWKRPNTAGAIPSH